MSNVMNFSAGMLPMTMDDNKVSKKERCAETMEKAAEAVFTEVWLSKSTRQAKKYNLNLAAREPVSEQSNRNNFAMYPCGQTTRARTANTVYMTGLCTLKSCVAQLLQDKVRISELAGRGLHEPHDVLQQDERGGASSSSMSSQRRMSTMSLPLRRASGGN